MTIGDILGGIKNLGTKAAGSIGSLLSSAGNAYKNFYAPAEATLADMLKNGGVSGPAAMTKTGIAANTIFGLPKATADTAKSIAQGAERFAYSAGQAIPELPLETWNSIAPTIGKPTVNIPVQKPVTIPGLGFLGPVESYQNAARRAVQQGDSTVGAILKGAGSAVLDEPTGIAAMAPLKGLGIAAAGILKGGGGKALEDAIGAIAKSTNPDEIKGFLTGAGFTKKAAAKAAPDLVGAQTPEAVRAYLGVPEKTGKTAAQTSDIGAGQGKGQVAPETTPSEPTASQAGDLTLYHTTTPKAAKAIQAGGFKAVPPEDQIGQAFGTGAYFSTTPEEAQAWKQFVTNDGKGSIVTVKGKFNIYDPKVEDPALYWDKLAKKAGVKSNPELGQEIADAFLMGKESMQPDVYDEAIARAAQIIDGLKAKGIDGAKFTEPIDAAEGITNKQVVVFNTDKVNQALKAGLPLEKNAAVPKPAPKPETPQSVGTMKSVGDILGGGGEKPPVSRGTQAPIPGQTPPERQFITRTKTLAPEAAPLLKGEYATRDTKALVKQADELIAKDPAGAVTFAKTDTTDAGVATASRLLDNFIGQAKIATDQATKDALYAKAAEVANDAAKNLTEHGRAVQAASILGKLTPEGMTRWAASEIQKYNEVAGKRTIRNFLGGAKKIPELTGDQAKHIVDEMTKITEMTDQEAKAQAFHKLQTEVKSWIPSSLYQKIIALWKAGLLTGIKTSGLNIASNLAHGVSETVKDVPAALVDRVASLFTGKRTLAMTARGTVSGTKEGIAKGWRFFRTGYDERNSLGKLDFNKVNFGSGRIAKALQAYEEKVFNTLGSEDQPFYYGAKARSLYSQAIAQAKNEKLTGQAFANRVNELVSNPTDEMLKYAVMDAQTAVFQNQTALGKVASALQRAPGGEVILPFGKTPAAVATQIINYSPVGIAKTIIENIGKGRFDQRLFAQGLGRGLTGTGILAIGGALYDAGLMTTGQPTSEAEKKQWEIEGKQPYALKIGGQWRNIGVLGPAGMVLGVGAAMKEGIDGTGSFIGGLGAALAAVGGTLTQQTFLYGINQAINALNDPAHYGATFIRNLVGSVIPTIVADVARGTDTKERMANTAGARIISRVPGLREALPPRIDTLGMPENAPGFFTTMVDATRPYAPTENLNDPVVKELVRLDRAGFNATPTMVGGTYGFKTLSPKQNAALWQNAGTLAKDAIANIMQDPAYQTLDDEMKQTIIGRVVAPTKDQARGKAIYDATKGLSGKALADELAKMQADKLLSKSTYRWYYDYGGRGAYPTIQK